LKSAHGDCLGAASIRAEVPKLEHVAANLNQNQIGAILYYTYQTPAKGQKNIYQEVNEALNGRFEIPQWHNFLSYLVTAINSLPTRPGKCYRGLTRWLVHNDEDSQYILAGYVIWVSVTSCSQDKSLALGFMNQSKTGEKSIVTISHRNGRDVSNLSLFKDEKEILFPPNSVFKVESVEHKNGVDYIGLTEVNEREVFKMLRIDPLS